MRTYSCGTETKFPYVCPVLFYISGKCIADEINYTFLTSENQ
jgi:hypothetical protein